MGSFGNWLSKIKSKLPMNGDWLYVTETPSTEQPQQEDLATKHDTPAKVLEDLTSNDIETIKLIYERAKAHESRIENIGNLTRDKAKTLLGSTSLLSAVLFGAASFFSSISTKFSWWAVAFELALFVLLACHLIHSLIVAMDVMTREQSVSASPDEFLSSYEDSNASSDGTMGAQPLKAYKNAIAQAVAYANQTHEYIHERKNKLILGQHAFKYGLIYFPVLITFHILAALFYGNSGPSAQNTVATEQQTKLLHSLLSSQDSLLKILEQSTKDVALLRQRDDELLKRQRELETRVEELGRLVPLLRQEKAVTVPQSDKATRHPAKIPKKGSRGR